MGSAFHLPEVADKDLFGHGVEYRTAQLSLVAAVARLARGPRIDDEHGADAAGQLVVRMAVQNEIRVGLAKPRQ